MSAKYLIVLLCLTSSILALRTSNQMYHQAHYPHNQHFKRVQSPCEDGQTARPNKLAQSYNGCGSKPWQVSLGKMLSPYLNSLTPCCNQHDICFGTCGAPDFEESFKQCNVDFKECMYQVCLEKQGRGVFSRALCKVNAATFYNAVKYFGQGPYNNSQAKHCDCV